jgi:hypothetical protein
VRNPYAMTARTYLRGEYAWMLAAIPFWIFITAVLGRVRGAEGPPLNPAWALIGFFVLNFSAALLNGHLIGMIGSPRGRITPGLAQTHLVVAAVIAGILTVVVPLGQSLAVYGWRGPHLAVISVALAAFSISCYLPYWNRWAAIAWNVLPFAVLRFGGTLAVSAPTNAESLLLLPISGVCLFGVAKRCLNFEAAADMTFQSRAGMDRRREQEVLISPFRALWLLAPARLRRRNSGEAPAIEGLLQRARHWDAAWWNIRMATLLGTIGGVLLALEAYPRGTSQSVDFMLLYFLIPLCACLPFAWVLSPPWRTYWIGEFLRPYSRRQQVLTTGFVLAAASLVGSCLLIAIPFLTIWIGTGVCPATRETQGAIAMSLCGAPLFFALAAANWPPVRAFLSVIPILIVYAAVIWTPLLNPHSVSNVGMTTRAIILAIIGAGLTSAAYRSWLDRDIR